MSATLESSVSPTDGSAGPDPIDPAERIGELREQIDACDAEIIRLISARLDLSREIGVLRTAAGGTRLSLSREQAVLTRFSAALGPADGTSLGMLLLRRGRGAL